MIKKNFIARIELNYCMIWKNIFNLEGGKKNLKKRLHMN